MLVAGNSQLEALTIAFLAARTLASTAFSVLHLVRAFVFLQLFLEGQRVSFEDFLLSRFDVLFSAISIAAVGASALRTANNSAGKALAVELEAL